ncbi:hypothetical protein [Alkalihalobacterium chitinilyticum]|uniref:DUF2197 domain-containing protein n=1 Tax=Alkalihalobacterium chitinilyticum TaxID=2980103 RepID=A0ABT5VFM5_9BACI|nr:hypothetical protein [Alkalihalobacterium chitinilyticum]MDE5414251.1 hypothetical protein [Alkalihalobacterium chitinilyticum]
MISLMCGTCAIEEERSVEERKELSKRLRPNKVHQCPSCSFYFGMFNYQPRRVKEVDRLLDLEVEEEQVVEEENEVIEEKKPKMIEEQISLF